MHSTIYIDQNEPSLSEMVCNDSIYNVLFAEQVIFVNTSTCVITTAVSKGMHGSLLLQVYKYI